jgi:hypothetical protein
MHLLVTADVSAYGSQTGITVESEEWEQDEEDRPLQNHGLEDSVVWVIDPRLSDPSRLSFILRVSTMGISDVAQCEVVLLLIDDV